MDYLKNYNQFKFEQNISLFESLDLFQTGEGLFKTIFESLLSQENSIIQEEINNYLDTSGLLNEGFFDKLKKRFPKASEVSKLISDKGEKVLNKILQKAKDAVAFVGKIKEGIKEFFSQWIEKGKKFFEEQIKGGKLKEKISELTAKQKKGLKEEIKTGAEILNWYRKDFLKVLFKSTDDKVGDFFQKDQEALAESLNEGKNVIATMVHGLESIPPFSWLHKVAKAGEAGANKLFDYLSKITDKLGGPSFEFPVMAALIGIVIEQAVKGSSGHWLLDIVGSGTPLGLAIKGIKYVALVLAAISAIDALVGGKMLAHEHGDEKPSKSSPVSGEPEGNAEPQEEI